LQTFYPEPFFFGLSVDQNGTFKGTLTTFAAVPEPSTCVLAGLSLFGLYLTARRKIYRGT